MLISPPAQRTRGSQQKTAPGKTPPVNGVEVEVLVAGKYNGPDHKSIGQHPVGAILVIASGGYSSYLIQNGYVRPAIKEDATPDLLDITLAALREKISAVTDLSEREPETAQPETAQPEAAQPEAEGDPERPWLFWTEAGVIESVALSLWEAGFTSASRAGELGLDILLGVKGVGPVTADKLLTWAEAHGN